MRLLIALLLVSACATFPEVDRAANGHGNGPLPQLVPTEELLARAGVVVGAEAAQAGLQARAAALRARAARIRAMPAG
jgi:hypothetical protein